MNYLGQTNSSMYHLMLTKCPPAGVKTVQQVHSVVLMTYTLSRKVKCHTKESKENWFICSTDG